MDSKTGAWLIRGMQGSDLSGICEVAKAALPADVIPAKLFARKVFLDLDFDPRGCLSAVADGNVVGFLVSYVRRHKIEDQPDDSSQCWITLLAVHPDWQRRGIGGSLLETAEKWFQEEGKKIVLMGPYAPNWWVPGVDVNAYPDTIAFLQKRGFKEVLRPLSMDSNLVSYRRPQWIRDKENELTAAGVTFLDFAPELIPDLFAFLKAEFPGDWQRHVRSTADRILREEYQPRQIQIAMENGKVIGFAHCEGERFGPFGTDPSVRGRGIGAVLLCRTIEGMCESGLHDAFFLWTEDHAAKVYSQAGFKESRRFSFMKKELSR